MSSDRTNSFSVDGQVTLLNETGDQGSKVPLRYWTAKSKDATKGFLPFVIGVLADLSGKPEERLLRIKDRRFVNFSVENISACMKAIKPRLAFRVPNVLTGDGKFIAIELYFESMDDFQPEKIIRNTPPLSALLSRRAELKHGLEKDRISEIDKLLSSQLNLILHHGDFRLLEGAWRGLHHLVQQVEPDQVVRVKVLNISKRELLKELEKAAEFDQSTIFKKVYDEELGSFGGEPFGCLIGDYYFDHSPKDCSLLEKISEIAAVANAPFISGIAPGLLYLEDWRRLNPNFNPAWFHAAPSYRKWLSICETPQSRHLILTLPRLLARTRYLLCDDRDTGFIFREDKSDYSVWFNPSYALAAIIAQRFKESHWFAPFVGKIDSCVPDTVDENVVWDSDTDSLVDPLASNTNPLGPPKAEIDWDVSVWERFRSMGLNAVITDDSNKSIYFNPIRPMSWWYTKSDYSFSNEKLFYENNPGLDLSALLCINRFIHHITCLCRIKRKDDRIEPLADEIDRWLKQHVQQDPCDSSERMVRPLADGRVKKVYEGESWSQRPRRIRRIVLWLSFAYQFKPPYPKYYWEKYPTS